MIAFVTKVSWATVAWTLALATVVGCSAKQGPTGQPVASVAKVLVTLADALDPDDKTDIDEVNGVPRLRAALEDELSRTGRLDPGSPNVLEVQVTDFRLRSGTIVFLVGIISGVDILGVDVEVRDGVRVLRSYSTGVGSSGVAGGLSASSRFQPMADVVAERVVEQL